MTSRLHLAGLAVLLLLLFAVPLVVGNEFYLRILFMIGVYYLAAAGLNVLVGWTGQKSLGHAGLFAVGAYAAALLTAKAGWNPWLALAASAVFGGIFGIVIALPSLRVKGPSLAMVTIGFGVVVEKIVTEWQDVFGGQGGIYGVVPPSLGGDSFTAREWVWFAGVLGVGFTWPSVRCSTESTDEPFWPCKRRRSRPRARASVSIASRSWRSSSAP